MAHEFTAADERVFAELARAARVVGAMGVGLAVAMVCGGALGVLRPPLHLAPHAAPVIGLATLAGAAPSAFAGVQLWRAGERAGQIVATVGRDVEHVIEVARRLDRAFRAVVVMLAVDAAAVAAVLAVMFPRRG